LRSLNHLVAGGKIKYK